MITLRIRMIKKCTNQAPLWSIQRTFAFRESCWSVSSSMVSGSTWDMMDEERLLLWSLTGFILIDVDLGFSELSNLEACVTRLLGSMSSAGKGIDSVILLSSKSEDTLLSLESIDLLSKLFATVDMFEYCTVVILNVKLSNKPVYRFFLIKHTREKKKTACENLRVQVSNRMSQKKKAESQNEGVRVKNVSNSTTTEGIVGINCDIKE